MIPILLGSVKTHPCDSPVTSSTSFFKMPLYGTDLALPPALATIKTKPQEDNIIAITQCNDDARGFLNLLQIVLVFTFFKLNIYKTLILTTRGDTTTRYTHFTPQKIMQGGGGGQRSTAQREPSPVRASGGMVRKGGVPPSVI